MFHIRNISSQDEKKLTAKYEYIPSNCIDDLIKWYITISYKFSIRDYDYDITTDEDEARLFFPDLDEDGDVLGMVLFSKK